MSNCITVDGIVRFNSGVLDVERLAMKIDAMQVQTEAPKDFDDYHIWWFLGDNVKIFRNGTVEWRPGTNCRSSHTWRDFRATVDVLSRFALKEFHGCILIRDDDWENNGPFNPIRFGWGYEKESDK